MYVIGFVFCNFEGKNFFVAFILKMCLNKKQMFLYDEHIKEEELEMSQVMEIANSPVMWAACGIAVILVIAQALLFATKSYRAGKKIGLSESQMKKAVKSSAITSIGPSIVILSGMLSLLITVGGPMAWMRLSLIGSVMFESIAAGFGTAQVGVQLGADQMTELAFTMAVWTMILGSVGWVLFATFSANRMEKVQRKISGGDTKLLIAISTAAIIGAFSALSSQHLVKMNKNSIACILGAAIMTILLMIANKKNIQWIKEWALTISILGGMIITALL
jgi:hypothetical protein